MFFQFDVHPKKVPDFFRPASERCFFPSVVKARRLHPWQARVALQHQKIFGIHNLHEEWLMWMIWIKNILQFKMELQNWEIWEETHLPDAILGFPCEISAVNPRANNSLLLPEMDSINHPNLEVYTWVLPHWTRYQTQKCSRFSIQLGFVSTGCLFTGARDSVFFTITIRETVMIAPDLLTRSATRSCVTRDPLFSRWTPDFCSSTY